MLCSVDENRPQIWLLMVFDVRKNARAFLVDNGFRQTKKNQASWWRKFGSGEQQAAESALEVVRKAGYRGSRLSLMDDRGQKPTARNKRKTKNQAQRAAVPVAAKLAVIKTLEAKEIRLARDALKRATESRRQAEMRAAREVNERVARVISAAKGKP